MVKIVHFMCILLQWKNWTKIANKKNIHSSTINCQLPEGRLLWPKTQNGIMKYIQEDRIKSNKWRRWGTGRTKAGKWIKQRIHQHAKHHKLIAAMRRVPAVYLFYALHLYWFSPHSYPPRQALLSPPFCIWQTERLSNWWHKCGGSSIWTRVLTPELCSQSPHWVNTYATSVGRSGPQIWLCFPVAKAESVIGPHVNKPTSKFLGRGRQRHDEHTLQVCAYVQ